jgi:hypothetical protein
MRPLENKTIVQEFNDQWNSGAIDFEQLVLDGRRSRRA